MKNVLYGFADLKKGENEILLVHQGGAGLLLKLVAGLANKLPAKPNLRPFGA